MAAEVNNRAQGTGRATHERAGLIQAVHEDTAAAVMAAEEGVSKVEVGVQRSNVAGTVLQVISEKSRHSAERVRDTAWKQRVDAMSGNRGVDVVGEGVAELQLLPEMPVGQGSRTPERVGVEAIGHVGGKGQKILLENQVTNLSLGLRGPALVLLPRARELQLGKVSLAVQRDLVRRPQAMELPFAQCDDLVHAIAKQAHVAAVPFEVLGTDPCR